MTMKQVSLEPYNSEHFLKLCLFAQVLLDKCDELNLRPVVYGSVAYAFYTNDNEININDIDFLISETAFPKIIAAFRGYAGITYEHSIIH